MKVFLGGTCNGSKWRDSLIPFLIANKVDFFNPVVEDWTSACQALEVDEKNNKCDVHLYVITKEMKGCFSIAEAVDSAHTEGKHCIFQVISEGIEGHEYKSLVATAGLISKRGGKVYISDSTDFRYILYLLSEFSKAEQRP